MPNRVIKESLRTSESCSQMSAEVERHWVRGILLGVDDHGCVEITPAILKGAAYPLHPDVMEQHVMEWNERLEQLGVIRTWTVGFHQYAEVRNWLTHSGRAYTDEGKQTRNRRKTPIPPDWSKIIQKSTTPAPLYNDNELGHVRPATANPEPVTASLGPGMGMGMGMVSGMGTNSLSSNVGSDQHLPGDASADRSDENRSQGARQHTNTPTDTDLLVDYATEVLNKVEGIMVTQEREDRGTLLKIARHVPPSIVKKALADLQDARLRGEVKRAGPYFSARITTLCVSAGIRSPFGRSTETVHGDAATSAASAPT